MQMRRDLCVPVLISILFCSCLHFSLLSWDEYNFWYLTLWFHLSVQTLNRPRLLYLVPSTADIFQTFKMTSHWRLLLNRNTNFSVFNEKKTLIPQTRRIKINYSMFLEEMVKGRGRSGWNYIPSNWWSVFINRVPGLYSSSFMFLIVPSLILTVFLILVYHQVYSSHGEKKRGLLY